MVLSQRNCEAQEKTIFEGSIGSKTQTSEHAAQDQTEAQLDDVFKEAEYAPEAKDLEEEGIADPSKWWGSVNNFCSQINQEDSEGGYEEEDELRSLPSDDEDVHRSKKSNMEFDPRTKPEEIKFEEGMLFPTNEHLRKALKEYFVTSDREFKYVSNDSLRIRAKCKGNRCTWLLYARRMRDDGTTFRINKMKGKHNCGIVFENSLVDADWIAKHYLEKFRQNPNMNFKSYRQMTSDSKYSKVSFWTFYRAKNKARHIINGTVKDQYAILHDYCTQILKLNPGLDGCFLKGYCKGMLLAAIGIDANNSMFPLAYAIVEKENTDSWTWFVGLVKEDINVVDTRSSLSYLIDRKASRKLWVQLLKKEFPGLLLKQALWACARSTTSEEFKRKMNDLKEISEPAYNWLMKKAPTEWSKSHFRTSVKCDMLLNNLCESFNSAILDSRDKMIITLLESIRFWLMERMCKQRDSVSKWNFSVGKRIFDIIEKNKKVAQQCICTKSIGGSFQVTYITGQVLSVDLETRTCTCRSFDLTGIPCGHGIACIWFSNLDEYQFVDPCYKKEAFKAIYAKGIAPMPSPDEWENKGKSPILPPPEIILPGRPKKSRNRERDEPPAGAIKLKKTPQTNQCSNCKQRGHIKTSCKNQKVNQDPPTEKKRKGRPPKKNPDPETVKRNKRRMKQKARDASSSQQLPNAQ
ncbi:uncharacterized protein LOC133032194 [Cannabis sativa]|uniref:uncharacterized protein LOC133032194 n=1 Tax=Cannabis sativa TaxID=3483 RepID=UPI0029CA30D1|nr:uncharacterized protein LOC133032194 [Cannabis sativa]